MMSHEVSYKQVPVSCRKGLYLIQQKGLQGFLSLLQESFENKSKLSRYGIDQQDKTNN